MGIEQTKTHIEIFLTMWKPLMSSVLSEQSKTKEEENIPCYCKI